MPPPVVSKETCSNCAYYRKSIVERGMCRRYPPTTLTWQSILPTMMANSSFPVVSSQDWCGEWEKKE